jgi:hypothetical protein
MPAPTGTWRPGGNTAGIGRTRRSDGIEHTYCVVSHESSQRGSSSRPSRRLRGRACRRTANRRLAAPRAHATSFNSPNWHAIKCGGSARWRSSAGFLKVAATRGGCPGAVLVPAAYLRDWYRSGNSAHYRIAARLLNAQARALSNSEARRSRSFGGSGRTKFLGWRFESCNDLRHTARSVRWPKPRRKQPHSRHHVTPHFHLLDLIGPVHAVHAPSAAITRNGTASLRNSR